MSAVLLILIVLALLVLRQNLIAILFVVAAFIHIVWGDGDPSYIIEDMWNGASKEVLLAIPLFILCGNVMTRGTIAERLITIMRLITAPLPGGLAVATILSCAVFAAISGSSTVTLLAVGAILYPALLKEGYSRNFALGAICAGGTLGIIIPPSIPMILYGLVTETSVTDLFIAGIGPGILLTGVLSVYALAVNRRLPSYPWRFSELRDAFARGGAALLMPVILLGGIYSGYFTATESAAVALAYAAFVEVAIHRELKLADFNHISLETVKLLGSLFPVLAVAISLNLLLAAEQVPTMLVHWITTHVDTKLGFLLGVNLVLLVIGCFMDVASAILITAPLLKPLAAAFGMDPVHFGVMMIVNLEIGFLTPPIGLNLIVAMTAFREPFGRICFAVLPFIVLLLLVLMAVAWIPEISMYLVRG
jgi:C4-dicarboxylate transporter DctM subunit